MADAITQTTDTPNPATATASADGNDTPSLVSADGLLNTEAFADDSLRAAAEQVNSVLGARLSELKTREAEIAAMAEDAKNYRVLAQDPKAVAFLYEKVVGPLPATKPQPASEPDPAELSIDDDMPVDGKTFKKLVKQLAEDTGKTIKEATAALKAEVGQKVAPLTESARKARDAANWAQVVAQFPEADTKEYRDEISKVLSSNRVRPGDYEAAYHIANSSINKRKAAEVKAAEAARKAKAGVAAAKSAPAGKRVEADALSGKGGGWKGALDRAAKRLSK